MKQVLLYVAILFMSISLVACSSNTQNENTTIGAVAGALIGGGAGSLIGQGTGRVVAVAAGAIAGGLVGGYIGHSMDSSDNAQFCECMNNNPPHKPHHWKNKKTGARYTVIPTSTQVSYNGNNNCRTYETTAWIDGKKQATQGTACRQNDGTWQTMNGNNG